jgi:hypothetical protein
MLPVFERTTQMGLKEPEKEAGLGGIPQN